MRLGYDGGRDENSMLKSLVSSAKELSKDSESNSSDCYEEISFWSRKNTVKTNLEVALCQHQKLLHVKTIFQVIGKQRVVSEDSMLDGIESCNCT
jgi:hypothetical protein